MLNIHKILSLIVRMVLSISGTYYLAAEVLTMTFSIVVLMVLSNSMSVRELCTYMIRIE